MITVDSSVWIDYFNGKHTVQTQQLDRVLDDSSHDVVVLDVVLMEVLRGYRHEREWQMANGTLSALPVVASGGADVARAAAAMYRQLRAVGVTVHARPASGLVHGFLHMTTVVPEAKRVLIDLAVTLRAVVTAGSVTR